MSGRRGFPFRGWHDYRGLIAKPGWAPPDRLDDIFTRVLNRGERPRLFELANDPGELTDVAAGRAETVERLYGGVREYSGGTLPSYDA